MTLNALKQNRILAFGVPLLILLSVILIRMLLDRGTVLSKGSTETTEAVSTKEKTSVFETELKPIYVEPVKLVIESASINIDLVPVGVLEDGSLETPKKWSEGGWYNRGAKVPEAGNVIINAHYDDNYGRPAAFWNLNKVKVDDTLSVTDAIGRVYKYKVTDVFYIGISDPNRLSIFSSDKSKNELTLITCGGVWDAIAHNYNRRLVVKALLEN
jgi:LPXTG-site transpeptidase (sortase) family protein